jgi:hypothetical protein
MKRGGPLRRATPLRTHAKLRVVGDSDCTTILNNIQALLRDHAIQRDGGCALRHCAEAGDCGGRTRSDELILQAEPLNSRKHSVSCATCATSLCPHHHLHFRKKEPPVYWELIRRHTGEERWAWLQRVIADKRPYRYYLADWEAIEAVLRAELAEHPTAPIQAHRHIGK